MLLAKIFLSSMKFFCKIKDGKILGTDEFSKHLSGLSAGDYSIEIKRWRKPTSRSQHNSVYKFCDLLAGEFNNEGLEMQDVIRVPLMFTKYSVRERIWIPVQKSLYGTEHISDLLSEQIDPIYDTINKAISEITNGVVRVPQFPNKKKVRY